MKRYSAVAILLLAMTVAAGCGSARRITIEGYTDAQLNGRRIALLLPAAGDVRFTNAAQFAASRGVADVSAGETVDNELRTILAEALQSRLDSNTVLNYTDQPVAGIVPMSATGDFTAAGPTSWETVKRAAQEGNIDYLLVIRDVTVRSTPTGDARGDEAVSASYQLLDAAAGRTMTSGTIDFEVGAPRTPAMTYDRMALELTAKLPFVVGE